MSIPFFYQTQCIEKHKAQRGDRDPSETRCASLKWGATKDNSKTLRKKEIGCLLGVLFCAFSKSAHLAQKQRLIPIAFRLRRAF